MLPLPVVLAGLMVLSSATPSAAQQPDAVPELRAGILPSDQRIHLDGLLNEPAWASAPAIEHLTMSEPRTDRPAMARTQIKVLANAGVLVIGIVCDNPDPAGIVSFTKQRDGSLGSEDHVTIVFGTFLDGRSGYVFGINPSGARYDALINPGRGDANSNWDGIWDAATRRDERGWSAEIWIPIQTLSFRAGGAPGSRANERERVSRAKRSGDHGAPASERVGRSGGAEPPG